MTRRRGRAGATDPQVIQERRALERAAARLAHQTPAEWGVSAELFVLPSAADVSIAGVDQRGRVLAAKRSDPYDLLHAAGGLTDEQHRASRRLFRDMALAAGVRADAVFELLERIDGARGDPGAPTQMMIDASRRATLALAGVGPVSSRILQALNGPMIAGETRAWRGIVQGQTGEKDRNAQGALVRQACENLVLVYRDIDERARLALAEHSRDLRPFGTFGPAET